MTDVMIRTNGAASQQAVEPQFGYILFRDELHQFPADKVVKEALYDLPTTVKSLSVAVMKNVNDGSAWAVESNNVDVTKTFAALGQSYAEGEDIAFAVRVSEVGKGA